MEMRSQLSQFGITLLLLTIAIGPFFQGYFFPNPTLVAMAVTSLGTACWLVSRHLNRMGLSVRGDLATRNLLGLLLWCIAASVWSVYVRGNLDLVLQTTTALLVYTMLRGESRAHTRARLIGALTVSALVVALLGLLEYGGYFMDHPSLGKLLSIEPQRNRMFTVFQYPNTAAAFFLVVCLLQNAVLVQSVTLRVKLLLAAASGVIATASILTLSRGSLLVAPLGAVFLWLGFSRAHLVSSIGHIVATTCLPIAVSLYPITMAALQDQWTLVLLWAAAAAAVGALATWGLHFVLRWPRHIQATFIVVSVLLVATAGAVAASAYADSLPKIFSRITQFDLSSVAKDGRIDFFKDAVKLAVQRPWGYGGGGWLRSYQQVQEVNYVARDPHGLYALMLVEAGVPGVLMLSTAIVAAAIAAFRIRHDEPVRWGMAAAALTLAAHAAIDIDLSYYMLWLLLWAMLGLAQPDAEPVRMKQELRFAFPVALSVALASAVVAGTFATAGYAYAGAEVAVLSGDQERALQLGWRAISLDPLNSQFRTMIPTAENINRALALDPSNEELWRFVSDLFEEQGDSEAALAAAQQALRLRPMSVDHYERVAYLLVARMTTALEDGQTIEAVAVANDLVALGRAMEERGAASLERQKSTFWAYPALTWTSRLNLAVGKAHLVAGELPAAKERLTAALKDKQTATDAALWLHALYTRTGDQDALNALRPVPSEKALRSRLYAALIDRL